MQSFDTLDSSVFIADNVMVIQDIWFVGDDFLRTIFDALDKLHTQNIAAR